MGKKYTCQTTAHWKFDKRGIVEAGSSIPHAINFAALPEFGGEPGVWTPEHLLLAGVSTCFVATFRGMSAASRLNFRGLEVAVEGNVEKQEGGLRFTRILLRPVVTIDRGRGPGAGWPLAGKGQTRMPDCALHPGDICAGTEDRGGC